MEDIHFPPLRFLLTNTKVPKNTKHQVEKVKERRDSFPQIIDPILSSIGQISLECKSLFSNMNESYQTDLNVFSFFL